METAKKAAGGTISDIVFINNQFFAMCTKKVLDNCPSRYIIIVTYMTARKPKNPHNRKPAALRARHALNAHPEAVKDDAFQGHAFFDPRDLVQVRYEMLRRHRLEGDPVTEVAVAFGVSRQAFYRTALAFEQQGVVGLLPQRRGPKGAHKCTDEVLDYVMRWRQERPAASPQTVADAVKERFGLRINPRSIQRALQRHKKKRRGKKGVNG